MNDRAKPDNNQPLKKESTSRPDTHRDSRENLVKPNRDLRQQFDGFPIPTFIWKREGQEFILTDYNHTGYITSQERTPAFVGKTAKEIYQDRPDILEQLRRCFEDGSAFASEMAYTIPNTEEQYHLRVYYVALPPDRVMVLTEDNTQRVRAKLESDRRADEFFALYENSRTLAFQYDLTSVLEIVAEQAIALLGAREGALFLYDLDQDDLKVAVWRGPAVPANFRLNIGESVSGQTALNREPLIVNDYPNWEYRSDKFEWLNIKAVVGAPLMFGGELIGALIVIEREKSQRKFTEREMHLLSLFASQAAAAVRNARIYEDMRHRIAELEAVNTITRTLRIAQSLDEMLNILLDETLRVIETEVGVIWLYDSMGDKLVSTVTRGWFEKLRETPMRPGEGIAGNVFLSGEPYISTEFQRDMRTRELFREQIPPDWGGACLPIRTTQGSVGVLFVSVHLPRELKSEEVNLLTTLSDIAGNAIQRMQLHEDTLRYAEELALAYDSTLEGWARAIELKDKETEGHSRRVVKLSERLARALGMTEDEIVHLRRGVMLHDIGKMGIPDHILLKPGPLTEDEWESMRQHPQYAYDMLSSIDFLGPAIDIPYCHHERWDGEGYPRGLKGEEIPLGARIFSVVDVWDALLSDRPYRKRWSRKKAEKYIRSQAGIRLDPKIVEVFLKIIE